jgi:hypothetical protein
MIHSVTFPTDKQLHLWKRQAQHRKCAKNPAKIALRTLRAVTPPQSSQVTSGARLFLPGVDGRSARRTRDMRQAVKKSGEFW